MNEYTLVFDKGIALGLRHHEKTPMNAQGLIVANGVMGDKGVLRELDDLSTLDLSSLECVFPFPQFFELRNFTLVCTPDEIYEFKGGTLSLKYTASDAGTTWSFADFYNYIVGSNGVDVVKHDPASNSWSRVTDGSIPPCTCVCELNGQLILGNMEYIPI